MSKWVGVIGFGIQIEIKPGVWKDNITEKKYYGNINRLSRRTQSSGNVNDNIVMSNEISIIADPFANKNLSSIRYVTFMDTKWKVTNVEVQTPRLILTLGEVFNG